MSRSDLSAVSRRGLEYLIAIYLEGGHKDLVPFTRISKRLGISPPTVSIMVRRLQSKKLVEVVGGRGVRLSDKGLRFLVEFSWKCGIVEIILHRSGLDLGECSLFAEKMCFGLEFESALKLYKALGEPEECPHGNPIPKPWVDVKEFVLPCCLIESMAARARK